MIGSLIAGLASGELFGAVRRAKGAALAYLLAALFGLTGIGFLVGAAYVLASRRWGTVEAALGFGGGFLLIAIIIVAAHSLSRRRAVARVSQQRGVDVATIAGAAAVSLLPVLMRSKAGLGGLVGPLLAVAAYAIYRENSGRKPDGDSEER